MEMSLIISLIAAATSVAGTAASVSIAHTARRASADIEILKAELSKKRAQDDVLKEIETDTELLRIRCWDILGFLTFSADEVDARELKMAVASFQEAANSFVDKWAATKPEIPDRYITHLRGLRHKCNSNIFVVLRDMNAIDFNMSTKQLAEDLNQLLGNLDNFSRMVSTIRKSNVI